MVSKKNIISAVSVCIILSVVIAGMLYYNRSLSERLYVSAEKTLREITIQQKFNFDSEISAEKAAIQSLAAATTYLPGDKEAVRKILDEVTGYAKFEYVVLANADGKGLMNTETKIVDVSERPYFNRVLAGETVVGEPVASLINDTPVIPLATPVFVDGKVKGVLVGGYSLDMLSNGLLPSFDGKGYAFVINGNGEILLSTQNDYTVTHTQNLFDSWKTADFTDGQSFDEILQALRAHKSGIVHYVIDGQQRLACFTPLDENGWTMIVAVPFDIITTEAASVSASAIILTCAIVASFILLIFYILRQQSKNTKALERVAYYDELTGLPNINKFKKDAEKILLENPEKRFAVAKMDIADFKMINEMFNYETGNMVIRSIMEVGKNVQAPYFIYARVNADEFIMFGTYEHVFASLDKNREAMENMFLSRVNFLDQHRIKFRYGRYAVGIGETDINSIVEKASLAHRLCKASHDTAVFDYDDALKRRIVRETELANKMEYALHNRKFLLYLQPKYRLHDESLIGAEALVRWQEADGTLIPPYEFIPLFEKNGFIAKLDMYMLERVCELISSWMADGKQIITVSVNFSRSHLSNPHFVTEITSIIDRYNIPRKYIEVELTETIIFNNEEVIEEVLSQLHDAGFTLSMDDFGTGYSSLGLLKNLPLDVIKMDRSFFIGDKDIERTKTVIGSVVDMAKQLNIHTVAEGVESKAHIEFLREVNCDIVQGYYFARPMPEEQFTTMLKA